MDRLGRLTREVIKACSVGAVASSREMGRRGAVLYGAGTVLVLLSLVIPNSGAVVPAVVAIALVAAACAAILWFHGHRLQPAVYPAFTAAGTLLITALVRVGEVGDIAYVVLYVWAALFAFYFYRFGQALLQTGFIASCVLVFGLGTPADRLMLIGTVAVAGVWTEMALRQVRGVARTDAVTSILNRRAWDEEVSRAVYRAHRSNEPLSMAILDIDHFKVFNDEQGHSAGDLVLHTLAQTWQAAVRYGDVLARYGGEEFSVLLPASNIESAYNIIERMRHLGPRGLTCSAGIAMLDAGESPAAMTSRADAALYEAKTKGRNQSVLAPSAADTDATGWLAQSTRWASTVLSAVESGSVTAEFQPVVHLENGAVIGYEALARPHKLRDHASVEGFFAAAQRMGLTRELDYICRRTAIETAQSLPQGGLVFLNISVAALLDPDHPPDQIELLLTAVGIDPRRVVLEISERETITDVDRLRRRVSEYRESGFRFAVDDVGEGHATLEMLAVTLPEFVKVARSFCREVRRRGPRAAVAALTLFAMQSGAQVIAEGIEDEETVWRLRKLGIFLGQGFYLGRPKPVAAYGPAPLPERSLVAAVRWPREAWTPTAPARESPGP